MIVWLLFIYFIFIFNIVWYLHKNIASLNQSRLYPQWQMSSRVRIETNPGLLGTSIKNKEWNCWAKSCADWSHG